MDSPDDSAVPAASKPRTISVLGLFAAAAGLISYLATYAFTEALVKAEFLSRWSPDHDPRPKRFLIGFLLLMALFGGAMASLRLLGRQRSEEDEPKDDSGEDQPDNLSCISETRAPSRPASERNSTAPGSG